MTAATAELRLTHERDAAWLVALWLAVHGGDPAPEKGEVVGHGLQQAAALSAIAALATALDEKARKAVEHAVAPLLKEHPMKAVGAKAAGARLEAMGIHLTEHAGDKLTADQVKGAAGATAAQARPYCIHFRGQIICVVPPGPGPHHPQ